MWDNGQIEVGFHTTQAEAEEVDGFLDDVFDLVNGEKQKYDESVNDLYNLCQYCGLHVDDCECYGEDYEECDNCCGFPGGCFGCDVENGLITDCESPPVNPFERARWLKNRGKL